VKLAPPFYKKIKIKFVLNCARFVLHCAATINEITQKNKVLNKKKTVFFASTAILFNRQNKHCTDLC